MKLIYDLKVLQRNVTAWRLRIESRIKEYSSRLESGWEPMKPALKNALNNYKSILSTITILEVVLEMLVTKLETYSLLEVSTRELLTIKYVLNEVKELADNIPSLNIIIDDLLERTNDLIGYLPKGKEYVIPAQNDAKRIIEEARVIAESKNPENWSLT